MDNSSKANSSAHFFIRVFKRWALIFVIVFALITGVDAVSALAGSKTSGSVVFRLVFAAVASVIVNILTAVFIAPRMNKQYKTFRRLVMRIADEGYAEPLINEMEEQLRVCLSDRENNKLYISQYAMFLGEAYLSLHRFDDAEEKLDLADMDYMEKAAQNHADINAQQNMIMYHVLLIQLSSARKDTERTEYWLKHGEKYFSRMRGRNEWVDYFIDTAYFESLMVHEQYENAMKLLKKYDDVKSIAFGISLNKARCLKRMGDMNESERYFNTAYELAANDWRRKTVELERDSDDDITDNKKS